MTRIKLEIAYVGTAFAGWQVQSAPPGATNPPEQRTVQGELEKALADILGKTPDAPLRVHGSGRTDSGVHADMQVAHFDAPDKYRDINWVAALQRHLPEDIGVLSARPAAPDFHARFSATGKVYAYTVWQGSSPLPPKLKPFAWAAGPLDLALMDEAAAALEGEHDFAAFQNSGGAVADTTRTITQIRRFFLPLPGETEARENSPLLVWEFCGNGFLKQMVRNLMGFMAVCGQKKLAPSDAEKLFAAGQRNALNFSTAPACGLTLRRVLY